MKQQQSQIPEFMIIPDQIPYKKIISLKFQNAIYLSKTQTFELKLTKKCEDLPLMQGYTIERKLQDFQWVASQISKESPKSLIVPIFRDSSNYWQKIKIFTNNLYQNKDKSQFQKKEESLYLCKLAKRFICLLSEVSLMYLYGVPGFKQSSLFTFLDEKYETYRTDIYQQSQNFQITLSQKLSSNVSLTKKLFNKTFTKWFGKKQQKNDLNSLMEEIEKMQNEFMEIISEFQKYEESLDGLKENFLKIKIKIGNKDYALFKILCKAEFLMKFMHLLREEIQEIMSRVIQAREKTMDEQIITKQIQAYITFIKKDKKSIKQQFSKIISDYYLIMNQQTIAIPISDVYLI